MAFVSEKNYLRSVCLNRRRCFFSLLFFNSLLACVYYIYEHSQHNLSIYDKHLLSNHTHERQTTKINRPIESLRSTLNKEYHSNDLALFYDLVEREFALGLRCARKPKPPSAITTKSVMNVNYTADTPTNRENVTLRSSSSTNSTPKNDALDVPSPHRYHRTTFYSFTINNSKHCAKENIDLLIIIISKSENYKTRDAIRRTWGSGRNLGNYSVVALKIFFLIDYDEKLSQNIRLENNLFHDIIQVELPQQYTLVTHRVLALFEWSFLYCRTAKFLFKTDDDIFINLILLLQFVSPLIGKASNNSFRISDMTIYGYKHYNPRVFRQANDPVGARYVVTTDEFPCGNYPDFLSGFGYLIPKTARDALVFASYHDLDMPFRISDVYLTGILPDYLSLPRQTMSNYNIRYVGDCDNFFDQKNAFACAAGLHHGDAKDVFDKFNRYWQRVRQVR